MPLWIVAFIFMLGLSGTFFSFHVVSKRKKAKKKTGAAVAVFMVFCVFASLSAFFLASALLLIANIN